MLGEGPQPGKRRCDIDEAEKIEPERHADKDLAILDPANRSGPVDLNVIWSVQQGLISFKPGSPEWELDAAEELEQVSDKEIRFKLRSSLASTGGYAT